MAVRKMEVQDVPAVVGLWEQMMGYHAGLNPLFRMKKDAAGIYSAYLQSILDDEDRRVLLYESDGRVLAYIFLEIVMQPPVYAVERRGSVNEICVDGSSRRNGIASQLLDAGELWFKEKKMGEVECDVAVDNPLSTSFWKNSGYGTYMQKCVKRLGE